MFMKKLSIIITLIVTLFSITFPVAAHGGVDEFLESVPENHGFLISAAEVTAQINASHDLTILDVRDDAAYQQNHLANSINIPLVHIHHHIDNLPKDKPIYVISDVDTNAAYVVITLRIHGYNAWIVKNGNAALK
jgi:rhodanese-related sulfurtransferase